MSTPAKRDSGEASVPAADLRVHDRRVQDNGTLVRKFFDALSAMDLDALLGVLDDHMEFLAVAVGEAVRGKKQIGENFAKAWAAVADRKLELVNAFATEDWACLEYIASGTLTRQPPSYSPLLSLEGNTFRLPACMVLHLSSGKIDRGTEYFDLATIQR